MNIGSKYFANKAIAFPYIQINGKITRETYVFNNPERYLLMQC